MSPKTKRNIQRIIPFGLIWMTLGWYTVAVESMITGNVNPEPDAQITMSLTIFIFASIASFVVGSFIGFIEVVWLANLFINQSFWKKLLYKFSLYSVLLVFFVVSIFPVAAVIESKTSFADPVIWEKLGNFLNSTSFISTMVSIFFSLLLSLLYSGFSENIGHRVILNLITGRYQTPKDEKRIFLFLDMRSSTSIAEQLGHKVYFQLLQDYYRSLSDAIISHQGETYQYIGDEVVITWTQEKGLRNNNCIQCFYAMKEALERKQQYFIDKYGLHPTFKAGIHMGEVTTGEIGALKKEIFYTGDVLNTASRIQGLCSTYNSSLLVSEELNNALSDIETELVGDIELRGRAQKMKVYSINM